MGYKEYDEYGTRLLEYDDNNNLIHSKEKCGFEAWYEYDENGKKLKGKFMYFPKKLHQAKAIR